MPIGVLLNRRAKSEVPGPVAPGLPDRVIAPVVKAALLLQGPGRLAGRRHPVIQPPLLKEDEAGLRVDVDVAPIGFADDVGHGRTPETNRLPVAEQPIAGQRLATWWLSAVTLAMFQGTGGQGPDDMV